MGPDAPLSARGSSGTTTGPGTTQAGTSTNVTDAPPTTQGSTATSAAPGTTLPATPDSSGGESTVKRLTLTGGQEAWVKSYPEGGTTQVIVMMPDGEELTVTRNSDQSAKLPEQLDDSQLVELAELLLGIIH